MDGVKVIVFCKASTSIIQTRTAKRLKTDATSSGIKILLYLEGLEDFDFWQAIIFLRKKLQAQATATATATATVSAKAMTTTVHASAYDRIL